MRSKCPVKSLQSSYKVAGKATDFVLIDYGSHLFFQVTQVGKVGRIIQASRDKPDHLEGGSTFSVTNLLGIEHELVDLLARQLVEKINLNPPYKTLLLSYSCPDQLPFGAVHTAFDKLLTGLSKSE